jgi:hypothetical protein
MIDLNAVALDLRNAREARVKAERACCDIEELAEEIREAHRVFVRLTLARRGAGADALGGRY